MTTENQALARIEQPQGGSMALDAVGRKAAIDDLLNKVALVQEVMERVMHENEHFGKIPGCGDKPALLKAGAEKLGMTFRLRPQFAIDERDLGRGHREYSIKCTLSDGTEGVGSCSTMESKYRYRGGERKCPECGKATIIVGKKEFGGGFICFAKKGGCGAKFADDDPAIIGQQVGKVEHDNPADFFNTCLKMAKKRAHVDAIITATACSDIFTQDVEEMVDQANAGTPAPSPAPPQQQAAPPRQAPPQRQAPPAAAPQPQGGHDDPATIVTVLSVVEQSGLRKSDNKPWKGWDVTFHDGAKEFTLRTFDRALATFAGDLSNTGDRARLTTKPGRTQGSRDIVSLERADVPPDATPIQAELVGASDGPSDDVPF